MAGRNAQQARCQARGCGEHASGVVEVELPVTWEASAEYTVLTLSVAVCDDHAHDVGGRARGLLEARVELVQLLSIIERAAVDEVAARDRIEELERDLVEAEGALDYQRERADRAETA